MSICSFNSRKSHQRNHDFRADPDAFGLHLRSGFKDRAGLHFGNLGERDPEPAPAMTEHWIEFVQLMHAARNLFHGNPELIREFILLRVIGRQKFVQRRIQKTNGARQTI